MMTTVRILCQVLYFLITYIAERIASFAFGNKSNDKRDSDLKVMKGRVRNTIYHYLIENRGVSKVSIIIPSYNEEKDISSVLDACLLEPNVEIIISDGGSTDQTKDICSKYGERIKFVTGGSCRAECLNIGAKVASGDVLLFLHADTILPKNFSFLVLSAMSDPFNLVGAFTFDVNSKAVGMQTIVRLVQFRCKYFSLPYGDQALFFRREVFRCLGQFPCVTLMEDYDLVKLAVQCHVSRDTLMALSGEEHLPSAVKSAHKWNDGEGALYESQTKGVCILTAKAKTSARRWLHNGPIYNTIINQVVILGRLINVPHSTLAQWYYGLSKKRAY